MGVAKLLLSRHKRGQWYKKVHGKVYYFGTDYDKAVEQWLACKDHLIAGKGKPVESNDPTLSQLANVYHNAMRLRSEVGDIVKRSVDDAEATLKKLVSIRGRDDKPGSWTPEVYGEIKLALFEPTPRDPKLKGGRKVKAGRRAHTTVSGDIRRIRAFINWCSEQKYISQPDFGQWFIESTKQVRIERSKSDTGSLSRSAISAIVAASNVYFKPVVLLGINCGMGARDIAGIKLDQLDGEWLDCPRQKTGAERKIWLWPETRQAIQSYLAIRKKPYSSTHAELAFLTKHRTPWVRDRQDAATQMFTKIRKAVGEKRGVFYDLRRTFQTVGDETLDFPAVSFCMGHVPSAKDMASRYRDVSDGRIKRVCQHIRSWLYHPDGK